MIKLLTAFSCSFLFLASPCYARYSGGSGAPNDPYLIAAPNDINSIGLNPGDWDKHFKMISDIDMSGITGDRFNMIGYFERSESPNNSPFEGVFDGNGHIVSNFTYQAVDIGCVGLFSYVGGDMIDEPQRPAIIKNVGLVNPQISVTGGCVGGLVGRLGDENTFLGGDIINCYVQDGNISGGGSVGGIAGYSGLGKINKCYNLNTTISGSGDNVGGMVGCSYFSHFYNSYARGIVWSAGSEVGGFVGYALVGKFEHCYVASYVAGYSPVGAFVGYEETWFEKCFWDTLCSLGLDGIGTGREDPNLIGLGEPLWQAQTYIDAGWDFVGEKANGSEDTWRMCEDWLDYPKLWWQYTRGDFLCPDGVNFQDYSYFAGFWYDSNCPEPKRCYKADIDNSDTVDYKDLAAFTNNWLEEN